MSKFWIIVGYISGVGCIALIIYNIVKSEFIAAIGLSLLFYFVWLAPNMVKIKNLIKFFLNLNTFK
tara:strand:- start:1033 stop:1230 length:198 start_codon:yes stop_codon:yes gene_type:complete